MNQPLVDRHRALAALERPVLDLFSLRDRVAVVTGGSGRVGLMIARGLAEAGAHVVVTGRTEKTARAAADALAGAGLHATAAEVDVRSRASLEALVARVMRERARLDIVVNAAVSRPCATLEATSIEAWDESMATNARGLFLTCQVLSRPMRERRAGTILNVASTMGVLAPDFRIYENRPLSPIDYAFTKGGMINLTRYLATLLAPDGIRVNALSPGGVFSGTQTERFLEKYCDRVPLGRFATAADVKAAAVFLVSDASAYITGQNLLVDGGLSAW
jgi:NAD(P)-dependent dehydrogenase (short-subunit alcohol dehydrogenase family)